MSGRELDCSGEGWEQAARWYERVNELSVSKVLGISCLGEELLASEGLCSVEFFSCVVSKCGGYHMACVTGSAECGSLLLQNVIRPRTAYLVIYEYSTEPEVSAHIFLIHFYGRLIPKFCREVDLLPICIALGKSSQCVWKWEGVIGKLVSCTHPVFTPQVYGFN
jgi:hypothetical protein